MKIPVFVSCPTSLSSDQTQVRELIVSQLELLDLESRALGRSDYPTELPLREILIIGRHCAGAVILGFSQTLVKEQLLKHNTPAEKRVITPQPYPTPWNHLEAGILFALGVPMLVFAEEQITGGIFDHGVTDAYVHKMPGLDEKSKELSKVFLKWQSKVREFYYRN